MKLHQGLFVKYKSLLFFENKEKDEEADYLSVNKRFLWRRDKTHLVAFQLLEPTEVSLNFKIDDAGENIEKIRMDKEHRLIIKEKEKEERTITSERDELQANSIKTLYYKDFDQIITVSSSFLSRELMHFQRKIFQGKFKVGEVEIELDIKKGLLSLWKGEELIEKKKMNFEIVDFVNQDTVRYPYSTFKELLANAKKYNSQILFRISSPYFTVFQYEKGIYAVLTHKRRKLENS